MGKLLLRFEERSSVLLEDEHINMDVTESKYQVAQNQNSYLSAELVRYTQIK
jgi:hypothetical protein